MPFLFRAILIIHCQLDRVLSAAALFKAWLLTVVIGQLSSGEIEPEGLPEKGICIPHVWPWGINGVGENAPSPPLRSPLETEPLIPVFFPNLFFLAWIMKTMSSVPKCRSWIPSYTQRTKSVCQSRYFFSFLEQRMPWSSEVISEQHLRQATAYVASCA